MLRQLKESLRLDLIWLRNLQMLERVRADFRATGLTVPALKLVPSDALMAAGDILISRESKGFALHFSNKTHHRFLKALFGKASAFVHWLDVASPDVPQILVDCTDGVGPSNARYAYSVNRAGTVALPDVYFTRSQGYAAFDEKFKELNIPWSHRHDRIVWRGALNGMGHFNLDKGFCNHPGVIQRLRMAQHCVGSEIDFRFVSTGTNFDTALQSAGLLADCIPALDWATAKFGVDIDGFTNAWSNFPQRLKLGCCVLKVESQFGFRQWYYDQIRPWEHYVPIKADLSDLHDQIDWVLSNDARAAEIASNGQRFAVGLTLESETLVAARIINQTEGVA